MLTTLRANIGNSTIAVPPMALPREASVVFTWATAPVTSMVVLVLPTFSKVIAIVLGWFTSSSTLSITTSEKPPALAVIV